MRTKIGLERIAEYKKLFIGKNIGLVTNFTSILPDQSADIIDVFVNEGFHISKIFTPEHGLYGADAGAAIKNSIHPLYQIPVISLYGDYRMPADEDYEDVGVIVYDIQDVGLRYYTYIYTMCYTLQKAAQKGIPYVILDRPNPLSGHAYGPRMRPDFHSFVGDYELPLRYGLTIGEMAGYYLKYTGCKADVLVIPMENYRKDMFYPQTGLLWNLPSPALPGFDSTICYCGGCLFEAVNISEGRGTGRPFSMYGAPFIDMNKLYEDVKAEWNEDSIVFRKRSFVPGYRKYAGEVCYGLEFFPLKNSAEFLPLALITMKAIANRYADKLEFTPMHDDLPHGHLEVLFGNQYADEYLQGKVTLQSLKDMWKTESQEFEDYVKEIRLYR